MLAGISLVLGAIFVCQPAVLFGQTGLKLEDGGQYAIGVGLASTCCFAGGLMNVLTSKAKVSINSPLGGSKSRGNPTGGGHTRWPFYPVAMCANNKIKTVWD